MQREQDVADVAVGQDGAGLQPPPHRHLDVVPDRLWIESQPGGNALFRRARRINKGRIPADFGRRAGEKEIVHRVEDDVRIVD